jgi:DNA-binding transcriptional ArsR family regulator
MIAATAPKAKRRLFRVMIDSDFIDNKLAEIDGNALKVYLVLLRHARRGSGLCWPSRKRIAKSTGLSKPTITKALRTLVKAGLVTVIRLKRHDGGDGRSHFRVELARKVEKNAPEPANQEQPECNENDKILATTGVNGLPHPGVKILPPITDTKNTTPPLTPHGAGREVKDLPGCEGFSDWWESYPKPDGKRWKITSAREQAEAVWAKMRPPPELRAKMLEAIRLQAKSPDWNRDRGRYIPSPHRYLDGQGWLNIPQTTTPETESAEERWARIMASRAEAERRRQASLATPTFRELRARARQEVAYG